jgi:hypothetical protein
MNGLTVTGLNPFPPDERYAPSDFLNLSLDSDAFRAPFGTPARVSRTANFVVLDYDEFDRGEHALSLVFDTATENLVCLTRRFVLPQDFSLLFPPQATIRQACRRAVAQVRRLDNERVLVGLGTQQLILVRTDALGRFFPWMSLSI